MNTYFEIKGTTSTDDDRMRAMELGLAPSPPGFFDSSQEISQVVGAMTAPSDKTPSRLQKTVMEVVVPKSSTRSMGSATPARLADTSQSFAYPETPVEKTKKQEKASKSARKSSVAPSETSTSYDVDDISTTSGRPKRKTAGQKDYSVPWNADGTEIKPVKKAKGSSAKDSDKASSPSRKTNKPADVIVLDDDDDEDDMENQHPAQKEPLDETADSEHAGSITMVDPASDDDEEEGVVSSRRRTKSRKSAASANDEEMQSDEEEVQSSKSKAKGSKCRKSNNRLQESDEEEEEPNRSVQESIDESPGEGKLMPEVVVETPVSKGRGGKKKAPAAKSKTKQMAAAEEEEVAEKGASPDTIVEEEEEEEKEQKSKKVKGKTTVLSDASAAVNAGRRGSKAKSDASSSSSTPQPKSGLLDAARRFWGKRE
jgi:hypothetical protein